MKMEDKHTEEVDRLLMDLMKTVDLEEPSPQLMDKIIAKHSSQAKHDTFQRAKLPLFLLGGLFVLLFLPVLIAAWIEISSSDPVLSFTEGIPFEFSIWYILCPLMLLLSAGLMVQIELRSINHKKNSII